MTNQELYDRVKAHLLAQNDKSIGYLGQCKYHAPDGKKCAIGCLIPEDKYEPAFEGIGIGGTHPMRFMILEAAGIEEGQLDLARHLQNVHDSRPVKYFERALREVAFAHGLVP